MNPEEREELARLVPGPGDPVLPSDRYDLLKDHLMRELTRPAARPAGFRRRFAVIGVPLAATVATAVIITGLGIGRQETLTTDPKAADLLNRIATVAAAQRAVPVRDDQYVYIRTQGSMKFSEDDVRILRDARWTAVDGKRPGLSRITVLVGPPFRERDPFASYSKGTHDRRLNADPNVTSFRELEALPTDPDALLAEIYAGSKGEGDQTRQSAALETIGGMLADATLLPELDAALYRAAAKIPGVSVVDNAKDFAGRPGIGLTFKNGNRDNQADKDGEVDEDEVWVFDKKTLTYLGSDKEALLDTGIADALGKQPGD
ncbi:CU044_5270 family protein [Streptomyces sp. NPDC050287]|uniref:CU044_5270 family protein n=1 Tax=Streptomyces sp. NPDC050287 TaxID=3365608 RepID=UPI0037B7009B